MIKNAGPVMHAQKKKIVASNEIELADAKFCVGMNFYWLNGRSLRISNF